MPSKSPRSAAPRKSWTRDELLILLNIYHKMTFGQFHARNPVVIQMAERLGRNSNSVAMKLCNLASLDPALKLRGIRGLPGASALDRTMWNEFHEHLNEVVPASEIALRAAVEAHETDDVEVLPRDGIRVTRRAPAGPTEIAASVMQRRGQDYFRQAVLNNFGGRCGITQLGIRELLIASHIVPWGECESERLNVRNGLCLSRLHDAAFDHGLITFDDNLRLRLSIKLRVELPQKIVADSFGAYEGQPLKLAEDSIPPDLTFMAMHRKRWDKGGNH